MTDGLQPDAEKMLCKALPAPNRLLFTAKLSSEYEGRGIKFSCTKFGVWLSDFRFSYREFVSDWL